MTGFKVPDNRVEGEEYDEVDADAIISEFSSVPHIELFKSPKLKALILFECDFDCPPLSRVVGIIHEIPTNPGKYYRNRKWGEIQKELTLIYKQKQEIRALARKYNVKLN